MADEVKILGIAGSLRKQSYNRSSLRAAVELVPAGIRIETFDLAGVPLFNQDHEESHPLPYGSSNRRFPRRTRF